MWLSGFFHLEFATLNPGVGGVVAIDGSTFRGWNDRYIFSGSGIKAGDEYILRLRVMALSNDAESVFGTVGEDYDVELRGTATSRTFQLSGPSPVLGGAPLVVSGTKFANLDLH